ncbi:MAG: 2,4'-dihydroxyacetophenone dioxygenase family protein [Pseudomonadales bacterium]|nr:2,4'-dihydroxyacetophenone dioxygenase family protein [Pseudomonadales bacterium]
MKTPPPATPPVVPLRGLNEAMHVGADAAPFVDIGDGTLIQLLLVDLAHNLWITRNRMQPGTRVITHYHTGPVYAYTLQGRWYYEEYPETVNTAGSFLFEPSGSVHTLVIPPDQAGETIVWFQIHGTNLNLDPAGQVVSIADAHNVLVGYRWLCQRSGASADAVIVLGENA